VGRLCARLTASGINDRKEESHEVRRGIRRVVHRTRGMFCSALQSRRGAISGYQVNPAAKVLVLNIADGQEKGQEPAPGSGQGMIAALRTVLAAHGVPLSTSSTASLSIGIDVRRDVFRIECIRKDCLRDLYRFVDLRHGAPDLPERVEVRLHVCALDVADVPRAELRQLFVRLGQEPDRQLRRAEAET
jgi:hypothetical protein